MFSETYHVMALLGRLILLDAPASPPVLSAWTITLRDIIVGAVSGAVGGLAVLAVDRLFSNLNARREAGKPEIVKSVKKRITDDIFSDLAPGRNISLMKEMLGEATITAKCDSPVFSDDESETGVKTHSYIYIFENAHIKVTSKDDKSIDTLTVLALDNSLYLKDLALVEGREMKPLREIRVWPELLEYVQNHDYIRTRLNSFFAIQQVSGPPIWLYYTLFGYSQKDEEYKGSKNLKLFIGEVVDGVCISNTPEASYYIYDHELS